MKTEILLKKRLSCLEAQKKEILERLETNQIMIERWEDQDKLLVINPSILELKYVLDIK